MKLAMYKGPPKDLAHKISHWFTCLWTFSKYSHCELMLHESHIMNGKWLCASSSARDGGVRLKYIDLKTGHWDIYDLPQFTQADYLKARAWFYEQADKRAGYDWFGLLWFVLPIKKFNSPRKWFCSEAIGAALGMEKPHKLHPQRLLDKLR